MENYKIRPYARLLSMLGDQLIKNEIIALTELVKNAYDADASTCLVNFCNMNGNCTARPDSVIEICDDGCGMSKEILTGHFLNPATPIKKTGTLLGRSEKGRIRQGEKGIGRFSMFKLGRCVTVYSKEAKSDVVHSIRFDFEKYNDEFLDADNENGGVYLDQLDVVYQSMGVGDFSEESYIRKYGHGTVIEINGLKGKWGNAKINALTDEMVRLSPFEVNVDDESIASNGDFIVDIYINGEKRRYLDSALNNLADIINNSALYEIKGRYSEREKFIAFDYTEAGAISKHVDINLGDWEGNPDSIAFMSSRFNKDTVSKYFENGGTTECGDFDFVFYVFDFEAKGMEPYAIKKGEKEIVSNHRVYLYRDNVRVQPYGSPNDDWLSIDQTRSVVKVGEMFSNNQIIGQIKITKDGNPKLIDKTSREGLMEDEPAFVQLTDLIKGILFYVRINLYQRYKAEQKKKKENSQVRILNQNLEKNFEEIRHACQGDAAVTKIINETERAAKKKEEVYEKRIATLEQLAGVGMSVEMASHDIMLALQRMREVISRIRENAKNNQNPDVGEINRLSGIAADNCSFIIKRMSGIQQLFVSSKQSAKDLNAEDVIKRVEDLYTDAYKRRGIKVEYVDKGEPVIIHTTNSVLYQVFINLFDNSLYWLDLVHGERKVKICLDGAHRAITFADNGPGIAGEDVPYVFDAFYSCKGEEGRGLGLYTAKNLLNHYDYNISVVTDTDKKILCGANFRIKPAGKN